MAHLNLVMIHPFRDGNGRMARCLQTLVLARDRILEPPFSSIEEYLGRNTQDYYRVLASVGHGRWSPASDAHAWVRFCLEAHYIQAASVLRRVQESEALWSELDKLREQHRLPERTISALFDAAIGLRIRNSSYRSTLRANDEEISNQLATGDLRAMVKAGFLKTARCQAGYLLSGRRTIDEDRRKRAEQPKGPRCQLTVYRLTLARDFNRAGYSLPGDAGRTRA